MNNLEKELVEYFLNEYKTIWVQTTIGTQSICLTLFPRDRLKRYEIIVEYFWLKTNKLTFESIKNLILNHKVNIS